MIQSPEQRLAAVIGQIIVENAKLGAEVEQLRIDLARERVRADVAELALKEKAD